MALKIPASLKLSQLKAIAFQCGISTSGTKTLLTNRLLDEIKPLLPSSSNGSTNTLLPVRILSIDMGIRNLAYCVLDLPSKPATEDARSHLPSIAAWRRLAVSSAHIAAPFPVDKSVKPSCAAKEAFDPPTLSAAAYNLLRHTLLPHKPTHILIERQRFRSMGSPHILEWTIRVNMFESMLYAVLQTLKSEGLWEGEVIPITPGKVGPFWIDPATVMGLQNLPPVADKVGGEPEVRKKKQRNTKIAKILNKGAKIDLVKTWLQDADRMSIGAPDVDATAKAYVEKWHRLPGRKKGKVEAKIRGVEEVEEMGKLDDLADSLLQGMAWVKWEENKKKVLKDGVDALELGK